MTSKLTVHHVALLGCFVIFVGALSAQTISHTQQAPIGRWMNTSLSPDERAELIVNDMTLDEKIGLLHGEPKSLTAFRDPNVQGATKSLGNAGYISGIPRLGIVDIQMADATVGVTHAAAFGRYSTPLPSTLAETASWDPAIAREYGSLIGSELRDQGYTMTLGGGINLPREMRNGRLFEYHGEDPLLAGIMAGVEMKATQSHHVIGHLKHFALNDSENGRHFVDVKISLRAMRETSLLAFEIALKESDAGAVMCSYNLVNGVYACENDYLLNQVLRKEWGFKGFVVSDWGATHSTIPSVEAGLDIQMPDDSYYGAALKKAVEEGAVSTAQIDAMVKRIIRTEIAVGLFDDPPERQVPDVFKGLEVAQQVAESSIVLLKNSNRQLPLKASKLHSIAVIGSHADVGVPSGGGSAIVDPIGGNAVPELEKKTSFRQVVWHRSSPMRAIQAKAPAARVQFDPGDDLNLAAALAKTSDVAIVFVHQLTREGDDLTTLQLPGNQDQLVSAVAAVNPKTIVVVESGGPITMPWIDKVSAVLEAWYPGIRGGDAIANILFGDVNPSAKLPITFPRSDDDLPFGKPVEQPAARGPEDMKEIFPGVTINSRRFEISYDDGLLVGYRYFEAKHKQALFQFGFGLSYTTFAYSNLKASPEGLSFDVKNTGTCSGAEVVQIYAALPQSAGEPFKRLIGFQKVLLAPGEMKTVTTTLKPRLLSIFNEGKNAWELVPGNYTLLVGGSSLDLPLSSTVRF